MMYLHLKRRMDKVWSRDQKTETLIQSLSWKSLHIPHIQTPVASSASFALSLMPSMSGIANFTNLTRTQLSIFLHLN